MGRVVLEMGEVWLFGGFFGRDGVFEFFELYVLWVGGCVWGWCDVCWDFRVFYLVGVLEFIGIFCLVLSDCFLRYF